MKKEYFVDVIGKCKDFMEQPTALENVVQNRGHILLMSPKGHPELAGLGVEYCWGKWKYDFRSRNTYRNAEKMNASEDLHRRVMESYNKSLDLFRIRRFARKTRTYHRAYAKLHGICGWDEDKKLEGYAAVEKFVKLSKTHRCALDQDFSFIIKDGNTEMR
jgi:hypothetical protein